MVVRTCEMLCDSFVSFHEFVYISSGSSVPVNCPESLSRAVLSVLAETDHLSAEFRTALWMNSPDSCAVLFSGPSFLSFNELFLSF